MQNANFPTDSEGRTYHLFLKKGEVANRILTVGDLPRAIAMASLPGFEVKFIRQAPRLFATVTGIYKGTPVTIITSLMGIPNMDFTVRELRYCIDGPCAIVRVGTCGTPLANAHVGELTIPSTFHTALRNPDGFAEGSKHTIEECYILSKPIPTCADLHKIVWNHCKKSGITCHDGSGISACSFYSSQGRSDTNFADHNDGLVDHYAKKLHNFCAMEMESSHLCDLARCINTEHCGQIYACAAHIILAQRRSNAFLSDDEKHRVEKLVGIAVLDALVEFKVPGATPQTCPSCVWNQEGVSGDWEKMKHMFTGAGH